MKRAISIILTVAMLLSVIALFPVSAADVEHTLDSGNVGAKAYYFGGKVVHKVFYGNGAKAKPYAWGDDYTVKEGDASLGTIVLDGMIGDGEWGLPSVTVSSEYAAQSLIGKNEINAKFETPSLENTFYYQAAKADGTSAAPAAGLKYDVYFMWDADYLYVAAKVYDPDGHKNTQKPDTGAITVNEVDGEGTLKASSALWNADAFQLRVDAAGPNSVVDGNGYDASKLGAGDPEDAKRGYTYPWATSVKRSGEELYSSVMNLMVAYTTNNYGYTGVTDGAPRYNPHLVKFFVKDDAGNKTGEIEEVTYYDAMNISYYNDGGYGEDYWDFVSDGEGRGNVWATATPVGEPRVGSNGKYGYEEVHETTDYEIAIPWSYISEAEDYSFDPYTTRELGVSLGVLNIAAAGQTEFNSFLEWGNGVFPGRMSGNPQTCGGSNSLVLSDEAYTANDTCQHPSFDYPTCISGYKCTVCGYEKGYSSGHKYVVTAQTLPTDSTDGITVAECSTCHDVQTRTLAATHRDVVKSFYRTETTPDTIYDDFSVGYSDIWYERGYVYDKETDDYKIEEETYIDADGNQQTRIKNYGNYKNEDGTPKISYWGVGVKRPYSTNNNIKDDESDNIVNPFGFAVLDFTSTDQTGSYHLVSGLPVSYTFKQDIYLDGVVPMEHDYFGENGYHRSYYSWFGGNSSIDYCAGIFEIDGVWYFAIVKSGYQGKTVTLEEFMNASIVCVPAGDKIKWQDWNEMVFIYDKDANVASLYWNGEFAVGAYDYHFTTNRSGRDSDVITRSFSTQFYATDIEIGTTSIASKYVDGLEGGDTPVVPPVAKTYAVVVDGETIGEYAAGEEVTVEAAAKEGYKFLGFIAKGVDLGGTKEATVTFVMPENEVELTAQYGKNGDLTGDGNINISDLFALKVVLAGGEATEMSDVNGDGGINITDLFTLKRMLA